MNLPDIGVYWTHGNLPTTRTHELEEYFTCSRCGGFVNDEERHNDWHHLIEGGS